MSSSNLSQQGQSVKSPPPFLEEASKQDADNLIDLEEGRRKQREREEKQWLNSHRHDSKGNRKPPSLDYLYASAVTSGTLGMWACQANEDMGSVVHRWNDSYWQAVPTQAGIGIASDWLDTKANHAASAQKARQCWEYVCTKLPRSNPLPTMNPHRAIVPVADAYIEVNKNGFMALSPDPLLGMVHAVNITSGAIAGRSYLPKQLPATSKFAKFLERALPDPAVRALVQEHCGMTLLPGNYSIAAWWYGVAGSGKSTLAEIVESMHRQSVRLNLETLGDRFSLEPLIGASLILVDEVETERWAEGRFKTLVSGNGIGIDRKNEKALASYHSRAKWLITSNGEPFVRDKSDGVWRRISLVRWGVAVPENERDPDFLKTVMAEEGKLILDWMLEGARRIVVRGRALTDHDSPEASMLAKRRARNNSDSVRAWADAMRVSYEEDAWVATTTIYEAYQAWCGSQGLLANEILTSRQFWRGMSEANLINTDRKSNRRVSGKQADCYEIKILGAAVELVGDWASACRAQPIVEVAPLTAEEARIEAELEPCRLLLAPEPATRPTYAADVYKSFKGWVGQRIELGMLPNGNLLGAGVFFRTLAEAGLIDHALAATWSENPLIPLEVQGEPGTGGHDGA